MEINQSISVKSDNIKRVKYFMLLYKYLLKFCITFKEVWKYTRPWKQEDNHNK
jgi:hypothetical protein